MARDILVTPEQLESTAGIIEGLAGDYQEQYEALYGKTNAMAQTWQGKDNMAYIDQIGGFKDDLIKMYELMLAYANFLRKSAKAYRETQDAVTTAAKKLVN